MVVSQNKKGGADTLGSEKLRDLLEITEQGSERPEAWVPGLPKIPYQPALRAGLQPALHASLSGLLTWCCQHIVGRGQSGSLLVGGKEWS